MKLSTKLVAVFISIAIAVTSISSIIFLEKGTEAVDLRTKELMQSVAILKQNQLNSLIDSSVDQAEELAENTILSEYLEEFHNNNREIDEEEKMEETISSLMKKRLEHSDFTEVFIITPEGVVDISTDMSQKGKIKTGMPYFKEGLRQTYVSGFYYSLSLQQPTIAIATPIRSAGNTVGVLAARLDMTKISDLMTEHAGLGETGETYLVNKFNLLVSKSRFIPGIEFKKTITTEGAKDCVAGNSGHKNYLDYRGVPVAGTYMWNPELQVCLLIEIDEKEVYRFSTDLKKTTIGVGIALILLTSAIGAMLARKISRPITALRDAANQIGAGKLDTRIDVGSKDEFGELAAAFRQMAQDLKKSSRKLHRHSRELEHEVKKRTHELQTQIEQLEKFNRLTVGRELKMIELKKRIKELENKKKKPQ